MARLGLHVPPGFTISTALCEEYGRSGTVPQAVWDEVDVAVTWLEGVTGRRFGGSPAGAERSESDGQPEQPPL
jgi:pyruvate,orthophosphate dikinase